MQDLTSKRAGDEIVGTEILVLKSPVSCYSWHVTYA